MIPSLIQIEWMLKNVSIGKLHQFRRKFSSPLLIQSLNNQNVHHLKKRLPKVLPEGYMQRNLLSTAVAATTENAALYYGVQRAIIELRKTGVPSLHRQELAPEILPQAEKEIATHLPQIQSAKDFEDAISALDSKLPLLGGPKVLRSLLWNALCNAGYVNAAFAVAGDLQNIERKRLTMLLKGCLYARPPRLAEGLDLVQRLKDGGLKSNHWRLLFQLLGDSADSSCQASRLRAGVQEAASLASIAQEYWETAPEVDASIIMPAYTKALADIAGAVGRAGNSKTSEKELASPLWEKCAQTLTQLLSTPHIDEIELTQTISAVMSAAVWCGKQSEFISLWDSMVSKVVDGKVIENTFQNLRSMVHSHPNRSKLGEYCGGLYPILRHICKDMDASCSAANALLVQALVFSDLDMKQKIDTYEDIKGAIDDSQSDVKNAILLFRANTASNKDSLEIAMFLLEAMMSKGVKIEPIPLHELYYISSRLNIVDGQHLSRLDKAVRMSSTSSAAWITVHRAQMLTRTLARDPFSAIQHAKVLRKLHHPLTMQEYLALLNGIVNGDSNKKKTRHVMRDPNKTITWLLKEIAKQHTQPNAHFLNMGLNCYASALGFTNMEKSQRSKLVGQAMDFFRILCPDTKTQLVEIEYNQKQIPDWAAGCNLRPVRVDLVTYNTLVKVFCKANMISKALEMLKLMKEAGFPPDEFTYNQVIKALVMNRQDFWAAEEILVLMGNEGVPVTTLTINAFLDGYLRAKKLVDGISMTQHIFNQYQVRPDPVLFFKVIEAALQMGDEFEARRAWTVCQQLWPQNEVEATDHLSKFSHNAMEKTFQHFGLSVLA